ncbi:hypothetical protein [Rhizorhabdus sp. FW153]|uniref:hypothetical protein n=1 Tax=Rhizorhabdus sp. FW153 TaxID=3400216 RepID=UPI003CEFB1C8
MKYEVVQDDLGTHIHWVLEGVTATMIDWFWSNMEKGFILWHPEQHEAMSWPIPPIHGNLLGAVHNAPQTWDDGRRQDLYIRFERFEDLPDAVREVIHLEHVIVVAGLGFDEASIQSTDPMGYRVHQWQKSDGGVIGHSTGIGARKPENHEQGKVWAAHAATEIGNWVHFLPDIYRLYRVVTDTRRNPFTDLSVDGKGLNARYRYITSRQS